MITNCEQKQRPITDWLYELPDEYTFFKKPQLDSLIKYNHPIRVDGDSHMAAELSMQTSSKTASLRLSLVALQPNTKSSAFVEIAIKQLDRHHLMASRYSGTRWAHDLTNIDLFRIEGNTIIPLNNETLNAILTRNSPFELSSDEQRNGTTAADFFTSEEHTVKLFYQSSSVLSDQYLEVNLSWDGSAFSYVTKTDNEP